MNPQLSARFRAPRASEGCRRRRLPPRSDARPPSGRWTRSGSRSAAPPRKHDLIDKIDKSRQRGAVEIKHVGFVPTLHPSRRTNTCPEQILPKQPSSFPETDFKKTFSSLTFDPHMRLHSFHVFVLIDAGVQPIITQSKGNILDTTHTPKNCYKTRD